MVKNQNRKKVNPIVSHLLTVLATISITVAGLFATDLYKAGKSLIPVPPETLITEPSPSIQTSVQIIHRSSKSGAELATELSNLNVPPDASKIWGTTSMASDINVWYVNADYQENWEYVYQAVRYSNATATQVPLAFSTTDKIVPLGFGTLSGDTVFIYFKVTKVE